MNCVKTWVVALILGAWTSNIQAGTMATTELNFRVLLDGAPIGAHRFELQSDGDSQRVLSQAAFNVRFLFIDVYSYRHSATEIWREGCLDSLESQTDDDGKIDVIQARQTGDLFLVESSRAGKKQKNNSHSEEKYQGCVRSFAYWNPRLLESGRLLNPQTGEYLQVNFTSLGKDRVSIGGSSETVERYRLSGKDLDIDLWYTIDFRWVALESRVEGGRILRYEIQ